MIGITPINIASVMADVNEIATITGLEKNSLKPKKLKLGPVVYVD